MSAPSQLKKYYDLTKPGIVRGNLLTVIAGFLLASRGDFHIPAFVGVVLGTAFIIASACVVNNYIDRDIDKKMKRTNKRALVTGEIRPKYAMLFAVVLGLIGFGLIVGLTNLITVAVGIAAYVMYVFVYAAAKRGSYHGTLVGAIPGALPPVAGYVAVSGSLDLGALLLFCILVFWQMPHFYAIAIYRRAEYKAAGIPVISVAKGVETAKRAILLYIVAFMIAALCLALAGYVGWIYVVVMALMSVIWLVVGVKGLRAPDSDSWARMMFRYSLIVTLVFSILISVDNLFTALYS